MEKANQATKDKELILSKVEGRLGIAKNVFDSLNEETKKRMKNCMSQLGILQNSLPYLHFPPYSD